MNYENSRGEHFGKLKIKDNVELASKEKDTLNVDVNCQISKEDKVNHISTMYHQNNEWGIRILL